MIDSLKASEEGLKIVDEARRRKHLQKYALKWATVATTSQATLKRFWRKCAIERSNFIAICQAVGVNWQEVAEGNYAEEIEQILSFIPPISPELEKKVIGYEQTKSFALPEKIAPVRNWVGRAQEIDTLKSQILDPETRAITITAVCLVGLAGIGKTTLASQLIRQLQAENAPFTVAAWETLRSPTGKAPRFDSIIDSLLLTLSNGEISAATTQNDYRQKTEILLRLLKQKPCLVVLDNVETVLQTGQAQKTGYFADDCFEYLWLFKHIVETEHQSKVIFTSRESLAALSAITVRELRLNGLERKDAINLLESHQQCLNLTTTSEELAQLAERYQGHPKALEIVSALIRDEPKFNGQVGKFLHDRQWLLINTLDQLIEEVFIRLSDLERTCLSRISVYQTSEYPLDTAGIAAQMPEVSEYELEESIIQGLRRRQLLDYDDRQKSYQIHPLIQEKAHRLLQPHPKIVTSESLFANRQAYRYFLGIPLKPDTEWQEIEDIKPLLRAHYHACCAADWDEAATAISGIYGFYFQILRALYLKLIPTDWKDGKQLVNLPEVHSDIFQYLGLACCQLGELQLGIKSLSVSFSTPSEEISFLTIPSTPNTNIIRSEMFSNSASNQELSISNFIGSDVTGTTNLSSFDQTISRFSSSDVMDSSDLGSSDNPPIESSDDPPSNISVFRSGDIIGVVDDSIDYSQHPDWSDYDLPEGKYSLKGIAYDAGGYDTNIRDYNDIMIENIDSKTREFQVSLDYLQQSLVIARKIAAREIESKTLVIEEPKQYYLGDYYLGMANFKEALKIARQIGYIEKQENKS